MYEWGACTCRLNLLVSVSSLVCEVGIISIYATSLALRRASGTMTSSAASDAAGGGGGESHVDGGLDGLDSGRANTTESLLICASILLTVAAFVGNVLGARRLLRAVRAGTTSLRASTHALRHRSAPQLWATSVHPGTASSRRSGEGVHCDGDGGLEQHVEWKMAPPVCICEADSVPTQDDPVRGVPARVPSPAGGPPLRVLK